MRQRDKLVAKLRARPPEAEYRDVKQPLEMLGWSLRTRSTGSHRVFTKHDEERSIVPVVGGRKVKRVYLDQICERLGLDDEDE